MIHETRMKISRFVKTFTKNDLTSPEETRTRYDHSGQLVSAPQPVQNLSVTGFTATTVSLDWDEPAFGTWDDYTVYVYNNSTGAQEQKITGISLTEAEVVGLTTDDEYEFWVVSVRDGIESEESNHVVETPFQLLPDAPENFIVDLDNVISSSVEIIDDTWASKGEPDEVKKSTDSERLLITNDFREVFIKLDISKLTEVINSAIITFTIIQDQSGSNAIELYELSSNTWDGGALTWNNRPTSVEGLVDTSDTVFPQVEGETVELDITSLINDNILEDEVSFVLKATTQNNFRLASTRNTTYSPPALAIQSSQEQVNTYFAWDAVAEADGYNVYLNKDGAGYVKQNSSLITEINYSILDVEVGDYQAYAVTVQGGTESDPSNIESFEVEPPDTITFRDLDASENQYFSLAHNSSLSNIRSIFMLIKYDEVNNVNDGDPVIHKDTGGANEGDFVFGKGGNDNDDYMRWFIQGTPQVVMGETEQFVTEVDTVYGVTLNISNNPCQLIINGELRESTTSGNDLSDNTNPLIIGERNGFNWDGKIYYLGFFDDILNKEEWQELYNAGAGKLYDDLSAGINSKLISYYNMNQESGNEPDQHGNNDLIDNNGIGGGEEIIITFDLYAQTDTHLRQDVDGEPTADYAGTEAGRAYYTAHSRVRNFIDIVNADLPDAVFQLGDITDAAEEGSSPDMDFFKTQWASIDSSVFKWLTVGNHDFDGFTYEELTQELGYGSNPELGGSKFNSTFVLSKRGIDLRVIFVDTNFDSNGDHANTVEGHLPQVTLDWIESILDTCEESLAVICSHHLPHAYSVGSGHFDQTDAEALRDIVTGAVNLNSKLKEVFAVGGHSHVEVITEYTNLSTFKGFGLPDSIEGRGDDSVTSGCIQIKFNLVTNTYTLTTKELSYPYP